MGKPNSMARAEARLEYYKYLKLRLETGKQIKELAETLDVRESLLSSYITRAVKFISNIYEEDVNYPMMKLNKQLWLKRIDAEIDKTIRKLI